MGIRILMNIWREKHSVQQKEGKLTNAAQEQMAQLPSLYRDRAFWGITSTQFLGAFNDSVFKQIVLLLCVVVIVTSTGDVGDQQFLAQAIFAVAFIFFSGIAGYWSDRVGKKSLIVGCKLAEVLVMVAALTAFATMNAPAAGSVEVTVAGESVEAPFQTKGTPWLLLFVLFLMGTQSAIFGPAKYGILPEMVRGTDLPRMNGIIQMTTFLAIILGTWAGGILLDQFHESLWKAGFICVGIAVAGSFTSLLIRRTPVAEPEAAFHWSNVAISPDARALLRKDGELRNALWVYAFFWFVAAVFPLMVNWLGRSQFALDNSDTSSLLATVSLGIAAGFVLAGKLSAGCVNFRLVRIGAAGLCVCLVLLALPDGKSLGHLLGLGGSRVVLILAGFFAGLFALPVQVFLQSRPPQEIKGRVIGAMNLLNWIAIVLAAGFFYLADLLLKNLELPKFLIFGLTGLLLLPIAFFYRSDKVNLATSAKMPAD